MNKQIQKIGIFSGTFDPVHDGHVQFALDAAKHAGLDRVYFMVERNPRRKQGVRAFEHRQAMVQLAIEREDTLGSIITEQDRFTVHETLPLLRWRLGTDALLVFLAGDDMLAHISDWPHIEMLLKNVHFIFGIREQRSLAENRIKTIQKSRAVKFKYSLLKSKINNASSSKIRLQIKHKKEPSYINDKVAAYIINKGLYSSSTKLDS